MKKPLTLRQKRGLFCLAAAAAAGAVWLTRRFWIWLSFHLPPCVFYRLTGLYCPGCGNSRSVRALLRGQFWLSLRYNVFPLFTLLLGVLWMIEQVTGLFGRPYRLLPRRPWAIWTIVILFLLYYVVRNIWEFMPAG